MPQEKPDFVDCLNFVVLQKLIQMAAYDCWIRQVYRQDINGIRRLQSIEVLQDNGDLALQSRTMNG